MFIRSIYKISFWVILSMEKKDNNEPANGALDPKDELKKIGQRLKSIRKSSGYSSPDKFAYDHNINRSQYGKYEACS